MWCTSSFYSWPTFDFDIIIKKSNCSERANIRTFAEDATLFNSSNSLHNIERTMIMEFKHLSYCSASKHSVKFKKPHFMTVPSPKKKISMINIALKNRTTANTRPYMDENLNRAPQIQHINSKISKHLKTHFLTLNPQTDVLLFDHYLHYGI